MIVCTLGDCGSVLLVRDAAALQQKVKTAAGQSCADPEKVLCWQQLEAKMEIFQDITTQESVVQGCDGHFLQIR
jgi:hypothetical protein